MELDLVNSVIDSANVEDCGGASACERKPCHNGGLCTETGSSLTDYTCQCEEGFSGRNCEIEADLCQVIRPCQNGGSCIGTYNAYKCNCPIGFGGSNCERSKFSSNSLLNSHSLSSSVTPQKSMWQKRRFSRVTATSK